MGCSLTAYKCNILCYADDIVLLCPSANGLQFLINKLCFMLTKLCLQLNVNKSLYIVFRKRKNKKKIFHDIISGLSLKLVREIKYLGVTLSDELYIMRYCASFKKQFNAMMSKLSFMNVNILIFCSIRIVVVCSMYTELNYEVI